MPSARKHRHIRTASAQSAVVDTFMDYYVAWRQRAGELDVVYRRWSHAATTVDRRSAFDAFTRAPDAEERAARSFGEFAAHTAWELSA